MARSPAPSPLSPPRRTGWVLFGCGCAAITALTLIAGVMVAVLVLRSGAISLPGISPATAPPTASGAPPYGDDPSWKGLRESPITSFTIPEFPRGTCDPGEGPRDPAADTERYQQYLSSLAGCLDDLWKPIIEDAGLTFTPIVVHVGNPSASAGGCSAPREPTAAYYCPQDHSVTFSPDEDFGAGQDDQQYVHTHYLWVLDHEYAHHVQAMTGIFENAERIERRGPSDDDLDISRRIELQAACIGEATLARGTGDFALTASQRRHQQDVDSYEADTVHGRAASQRLWSARGLAADGSTALCDTFSAQPADVR